MASPYRVSGSDGGIEVSFDLSEIEASIAFAMKELARDVARSVEPALKDGAEEAKSTAKFKDRSGDARRATEGVLLSMSVGQDGAKGELRCLVPYASFLNDGTPPHEIRPKAGRGFVGPLRPGQSRGSRKARSVLAWTDENGSSHFATIVHHPGTKPDGFMDRGRDRTERSLEERIDAAVKTFNQNLSR